MTTLSEMTSEIFRARAILRGLLCIGLLAWMLPVAAQTADSDGDGVPELIVANGQVAVLRWNGSGYDEPRILSISDAIGVNPSITRQNHTSPTDTFKCGAVGATDTVYGLRIELAIR